MRNEFIEYYAPNKEEMAKIWQTGLVVFDTNVLLDLYRLPDTARNEFISVMAELSPRIWIPHQVALEYQKRRISVIASERKQTSEVLKKMEDDLKDLSEKIRSLKLDQRDLALDAANLIEGVSEANKKIADALKVVQSSQMDIPSTDHVRDKISELFSGKIGVAPADQRELDELIADGEDRYTKKIPPGFSDVDKEKNPQEATFIFNQMVYQRKYGDLILWRQTINRLKEGDFQAVLFVTRDLKEDWWWREHGHTIGPNPELVREIKRLCPVESFWMYTSSRFAEQAGTFLRTGVSTKTVSDIDKVSEIEAIDEVLTSALAKERKRMQDYSHRFWEDRARIEEKAKYWLNAAKNDSNSYSEIMFLSFIASEGKHGFPAGLDNGWYIFDAGGKLRMMKPVIAQKNNNLITSIYKTLLDASRFNEDDAVVGVDIYVLIDSYADDSNEKVVIFKEEYMKSIIRNTEILVSGAKKTSLHFLVMNDAGEFKMHTTLFSGG